ncbi:hypothetical protein B296_00011910 [Ensete ventricosum]|uniref:Uncharacterized protein n=1 Tax=Ensete ventricosum TaxID=4639 RepID=A0A427AFN1_ENSVE|nr:hypothetical protein B296_00011910 [Ensete ventricosum]
MHRVDAVGNSPGVCRELAVGIESLPGWHKGVRQKKNETCRKIIGGNRKACRDSLGDLPKGSGSSLETRREIARRRPKTHRKNAEGCRIGGRFDLQLKKIGSRCRCASRRRTREWTVTGRMIVLTGEIKSRVNPMRVELIGDRSTVVNLSFWKVSRLSEPLDVVPKIPISYEFFDLISEVVTFLSVVVVVLVESVILRLVPKLLRTLHGIGRSQESFFFDLEKDLHPRRVQGRWPSSQGLWRLPLGSFYVGPLVILMFPCHQHLDDHVLVGTLEHLGHSCWRSLDQRLEYFGWP